VAGPIFSTPPRIYGAIGALSISQVRKKKAMATIR
jgi:hypothetical protein